MARRTRIVLIVTGSIPLLGLLKRPPDFMLLIYTLYALALLSRERVVAAARRISWSPPAKLYVCTVAAGLVAECLAWGGHYAARNPHPALLHPQLIPDLILGFGFYSGWALAWLLVLPRFGASLATVSVTTGLMGVFVEQVGAVFLQMIALFTANPFVAIMMGVFVASVYGSIMGLAYLPVAEAWPPAAGRRHWQGRLLAVVLMVAFSVLGTAAMKLGAHSVGLMPEPGPIGARPLW